MLVFVSIVSLLFSMSFVTAENCAPEITLLNQDPYPALPSEYVKVVFSVSGLNNPECGQVYVELLENFPIAFDSGTKNYVVLDSGGYVSGYDSNALVPFKVKLSEDALNDEYEIKVKYASNYDGKGDIYLEKKFNLSVEESNTLFEVSVKDYDYAEKTLTFEIINVGDQDVEALTVDIVKQDSFSPIGTTRSIVGGLDSNDDTSFTFDGTPKSGEINLKISYNDEQNTRRIVYEKANFDESLFSYKLVELQKPNYAPVYIGATLLIIIGLWIRSYFKRKRKLEQMRNRKA